MKRILVILSVLILAIISCQATTFTQAPAESVAPVPDSDLQASNLARYD